MIENLFYVVNGLIISGYVGYILLILINNRKKLKKMDGFNAAKDIISEYNSINIIENRGLLTYYNLKRKVIKISSKCYKGNSVTDVSIPLIEAGISACDDKKNKLLSIFKSFIFNLKLLYILPLILIFINNVTYNIADARIGIVISILFSTISFMLINVKCDSRDFIYFNLKKERVKILYFVNKVILLDKLIFMGELTMIIRCVAILLDIN